MSLLPCWSKALSSAILRPRSAKPSATIRWSPTRTPGSASGRSAPPSSSNAPMTRCSDSARICASVAAKQNSIRDAGIRRRWKSRRTRRSISGPSARPAAPVRCARACSRVSASARASKLDPDCRSHCELFAGLPACDVGRLETPDGLTIYVLLCSELYDRDGTPYARA
jgi:hypothetical protein